MVKLLRSRTETFKKLVGLYNLIVMVLGGTDSQSCKHKFPVLYLIEWN